MKRKNFFSKNTVLNAQLFLNSFLENLKLEVSVSLAQATILQLGGFLWADSVSPSGFASSLLSDLEVSRPDLLQEGIILDYATKHEMSKSSLEKLTKTQILFPKELNQSLERLRGFKALSSLFFGEISYPVQGLSKLINLCESNKDVLRTKIYFDEMFIAKLLYLVDDRMFQWLKQCCRVSRVSETNIALMDFAQIFYDMQANRFMCFLPPSIKKLTKDQVDDNGKKNKKSKLIEKITNLNQNPDWKMRQDESWDSVFKNKTIGSPVLSMGCRLCLKYHVKGICYSDCAHKASHCIIIGDDKTKCDKYIKTLRGE